MEPSPLLPPSRIGQIAVPVRDIDGATAFYRDVLGLQHLFSAPPGLSFFRCGEVRLMLARPESEGGDDRSSVLYYAVDDLEPAHRALVDRGAEVTRPPHLIHKAGNTELWMSFYGDGQGNTFALMSELSATASP